MVAARPPGCAALRLCGVISGLGRLDLAMVGHPASSCPAAACSGAWRLLAAGKMKGYYSAGQCQNGRSSAGLLDTATRSWGAWLLLQRRCACCAHRHPGHGMSICRQRRGAGCCMPPCAGCLHVHTVCLRCLSLLSLALRRARLLACCPEKLRCPTPQPTQLTTANCRLLGRATPPRLRCPRTQRIYGAEVKLSRFVARHAISGRRVLLPRGSRALSD